MTTVTRPTLLLDEVKCRANIARMADKAARNGLTFRPHFKTHQSAEIGEWFRKAGVTLITVSSVRMAMAFAGAGWNDITIAFPANLHEMADINRLAAGTRLHLLVESADAVQALGQALTSPVGIFVKIDTGYHRTGIEASDTGLVDRVLGELEGSRNMRFSGFLTHAGHTYKASSPGEVVAIHRASTRLMAMLRDRYVSRFPELIISAGDTPSCSLADDFDGVNEIRPGNFVFYDLMQYLAGSCTPDQVAVAMACPVVAVHPMRDEAVIYGGSVHFSKEQVAHPLHGTIFGLVTRLFRNGSDILVQQASGPLAAGEADPAVSDGFSFACDAANDISWSAGGTGSELGYLSALSQEHGIVKMLPAFKNRVRPGDWLLVTPVHSCLAAACMGEYLTTGGKTVLQIR